MGKIKFILIIVVTFLIQIISFVLTNEYNSFLGYLHDLFEATFIILAFITLLLYFWKRNTLKNSYILSNKYFYISIIVTWTILSVISFVLLYWLLEINVLKGHGGLLSGIEYLLIPYIYQIEMFAILVLDFLWYVFKRFYKLYFANATTEQKNKIIKKAVYFSKIIICIIIAVYILISAATALLHKNKINIYKENAEIEFTYKGQSFATNYKVFIDFDTLTANIAKDGYISNTLIEAPLNETKSSYHYDDMKEVYNESGIQCYVKHYGEKNTATDTIFIVVNNEKFYFITYYTHL